ncbi:MAG: methyltransferase domain-containing protein [Planctomycetia bacterium]|nr:methyltransferase domain-containing protein [Planctomycetia bacterium]
MSASELTTYDRAANTGGYSEAGIYRLIATILKSIELKSPRVLDISCGTGQLREFIAPYVAIYEGADLVRYPELPAEVKFNKVDLDTGRVPVEDGTFDAVLSVETIEHLENPRAFTRELVRITKPNGWIVITTPNQLSILSKLTLLLKNHFTYFGASLYPGHLTALIELDLRRIASECGLLDIRIIYGYAERIVLTSRSFPDWMVRLFPRSCSRTVAIAARKPGDSPKR